MKEYQVTISQNDWEYEGYANITCNHIFKVADDTVVADGIKIQFDEEISDDIRVVRGVEE